MPPIINAQGISKAFGANPLFQNVSFTISEGDRIGLIGPNGSGKSTLLRILAGDETPDDGEIAFRKRLRVSYVEQDSKFESGATVRSVTEHALERSEVHQTERGTRFAETLGRAGFEDLEAEAAALSGGWQKRLAIVEALVQAPDILLLDEPTNHLDLAGIEWLEALAGGSRIRQRDRESRPLFSGKHRHRHGRTEPRLSRWNAARAWKLQHVPGEERRISARAIEASGSAGKSGSQRN